MTRPENYNIKESLTSRCSSIPEQKPAPHIRIHPNNEQTFNYSNSKENYYKFSSTKHNTKLLNIAQDYVNKKIIEVTPEEYEKLSPKTKKRTQVAFLEEFGSFCSYEAWCALTVSKLSKEAGMNIGKWPKPRVDDFIKWGKSNGRYKQIHTNILSNSNIKIEREMRAGEIFKQLPHMKEGDFIIWKADTAVKNGMIYKTHIASHIGIIEKVDTVRGLVTVIEGNANITKTGSDGEALIVTNKQQGINGNQEIGEVQEINRYDSLIRKTYTVEQLARGGYSGYIDNMGIVK